ncbi:MAG: NAD-dependent malic enzyme [Pseudomonadales bacterium]|jgi:malic enzyme
MTRKVVHTQLRGNAVLRDPLLNKGSAFTGDERALLGLEGLLPAACNTQDQQAVRFYERLSTVADPLARYRDLSALHDRNEHLYYRVLMDHLPELMPIVYTPTVGLATQKFSEVFQRGRGIWITPEHRGRIRQLLEAAAAGRHIRLAVVTDNESILGIGDQGAGGMAISIGKLSLYTAAAGIDPAETLPISLDVGTNNRALLQNDLYLGWAHDRLSGPDYDSLVEEFVTAFTDVFPDALLQWEDFRKDNALHILERYRSRARSFNDDIQGTGAVALAGLFSALRIRDEPISAQRIIIHGAGAAGLGIARQIKEALASHGVPTERIQEHVALLDSHGLLVDDRPFADAYKAELAWPHATAREFGIDDDRSLEATVAAFKPTVLIGTSGQSGAFHRDLVKTMHQHCPVPVIMPMSNPTSNSEASPDDLLAWTEGQALIATGSPFAPVVYEGRTIEIGQGNNVFIFPSLGLGTLLSGAQEVTDTMITAAASALADQVTDAELERGLLYPSIDRLRETTAVCTAEVWRQAAEDGVALTPVPDDLYATVRDAMWWPEYPEFN